MKVRLDYLPMASLEPIQQAKRRAANKASFARWRAKQLPRRLTLKAWNAYVRAEKRLLRGFQLGLDVHELYRRWQDWKTEERLYELATAALDKTANVG